MTSTTNNSNNNERTIAVTLTAEQKETAREVIRRMLSKTDLLSKNEVERYKKLLERFS